jgi:hypothetical protein
MAEQTRPQRKGRSRGGRRPLSYIHRPNAVCITIHSQDGSPVPRSVLNEAADSVTQIALRNGLLINLAET